MKVSLFIISLALLTIAPAIYFGTTLFDGKVNAEPYEIGLKYDENKNYIKEKGYVIKIKEIRRDEKTISLKYDLGNNIKKKHNLIIQRPAKRGHAPINGLQETHDGYAVSFPTNGAGYYQISAEFKEDDKDIVLSKNFYIK